MHKVDVYKAPPQTPTQKSDVRPLAAATHPSPITSSEMIAWHNYTAWLAFAIVVVLAIYFRISGRVLKIDSIHPLTLSYSRHIHNARDKLYSISASSPLLKLHIPRPRDPHWAKLIIQNYQYRDGRCGVSIATIHITFWFFPVLFRFTGGPLLTLIFDDFRLHVYNSALTPRWLRQVRDNIVYTILQEETISLYRFKSRTSLSELMGLEPHQIRYHTLMKEKSDEEPTPRLADQIKIYAIAEQWSIRNKLNNRMYNINFEMEHRKAITEDKATLKMIIRESNILLSKVSDAVSFIYPLRVVRYVMQTALQLPKQLFDIIRDPLSLADVDIDSCYVTYSNFNLQHSALVEEGSALIRDKFERSKKHGLFSNASIDNFVQTIVSLYDRDR
ncbi:hypothetical protein AGABI1DRAFT_124586 [Agaricus bisporus var. burnettii JB137-S8]|uniref:Uncharacterized protein n=1 Tax=Agaricus bisporus var. burnettii (strain JB137-S8 / ATCC MYA-4627 / FGSC 10392) TaxID=597362 RepID=K5Y7N2_AGABU|nr:uncharacterized protein AGABI1DRAFT_124586 [Agaricus bisporus var. burnettii JB137-S8]EKM84265.1 hypothetical protein AGABI1DRAFT_124586 [Agaricus bisporus var. burnettii JB137-S8]